jgi:predicted MFS family arabinose efflux permease
MNEVAVVRGTCGLLKIDATPTAARRTKSHATADTRAQHPPGPVLPGSLIRLFAISSGISVASLYYVQPLLDRIADDFGISYAAAGIIFTITQTGYGVGLLLVVPLADLFDRRRLIVGLSLLSAIALATVAAAPTTKILFAAFGAVGVLAVVAQVLLAYATILAHPSCRGRVVGTVTSGIVGGILLARTIAGALSDLFGWRTVYLASAFATLVIVVLLFKALPQHATSSQELSFPRLTASTLTLFADEATLRIRATLALLTFAAFTTLLTPMVLHLAGPPFSLSHTQIGLFGFAGVAGALGASYAGRLADQGYAQRATAIGLVSMFVSWLLSVSLSYSFLGLIIGAIAIEFGLQCVHVANQSLIYRLRPLAQGRLAAAYMIFYSIGCAAGSIVSTLVYAQTGWYGVCVAGGVISAIALMFWAITRNLISDVATASERREVEL